MQVRKLLVALALAGSASPAIADHAGPSVGGGGGGLIVSGPATLDQGHGSFALRLGYTRPDQRSDAELEALAARHIHAHNSNYNLTAALGLAYGLTHRLTLSAELPFVRRARLREGEHSQVGGASVNEVVPLGSSEAIGDLSLITKYHLTPGAHGGLALIAGIKAPTGTTHRRTPDGERLETEHQPGTGSWDPIVGAAAGTRLGPVNLNASLLYQHSGTGAQRTRLGDRAQGGLALSHRFGVAEQHHDEGDHHDHHDHHDEADHHHHDPDESLAQGHRSWDAFVELAGEWEGRQSIAGEVEAASGGKSLWLSPGVRFTAASGLSVAAALGVPLWQRIRASHPANDYRVNLAIGHGF